MKPGTPPRDRRRVVALQAGRGLPLELRVLARLLLERVEDAAELRVGGGHFHDRPALHPADVHIVVEIDRARRPGRDVIDLQAGPREDEPLRRHRDVQMAEDRGQVAVLRIELERRPALVEIALEPRDGVGRRGGGVGDGALLAVGLSGEGGAGNGQRQQRQSREQRRSGWGHGAGCRSGDGHRMRSRRTARRIIGDPRGAS